MATTWDDQHRKARALRAVLARLEADAEVTSVPWNDETKTAFGDREALLQALHTTWLHRMLARLDQALELRTNGSATEVVTHAWQETARSAPGLRRLLDAYAADPALQRTHETERQLLAMAIGVSPSSLPDLSAPGPASPSPVTFRTGSTRCRRSHAARKRSRSRRAAALIGLARG